MRLFNKFLNEANQSHSFNFIFDPKIKTIYVVGGKFSDEAIKELKKTGKEVIVINGTDRYQTNSVANEMLDKTFDNVVVVNNSVDTVAISQLAVKTNAQLIMTFNSLTDIQKDHIYNNEISNVYYLNIGRVIGAVKNISVIKNNAVKKDDNEIINNNEQKNDNETKLPESTNKEL